MGDGFGKPEEAQPEVTNSLLRHGFEKGADVKIDDSSCANVQKTVVAIVPAPDTAVDVARKVDRRHDDVVDALLSFFKGYSGVVDNLPFFVQTPFSNPVHPTGAVGEGNHALLTQA